MRKALKDSELFDQSLTKTRSNELILGLKTRGLPLAPPFSQCSSTPTGHQQHGKVSGNASLAQ